MVVSPFFPFFLSLFSLTHVKDRRALFETIGASFRHDNKVIFETVEKDHRMYLDFGRLNIKKGIELGEFKPDLDVNTISLIIIN